MPFLGAHPSLLHALIERGITEPTPVQRAILEVGNPAADLMVSAQTGSGKTVGFGLAFAPTLLGDEERFPPAVREKGSHPGPLALVVTPTRELAMQVARELTWLYAHAGASVATCVGGMDIKREHHMLARGPHIVVGTPGRLCDHIERAALKLDRLRVAVLDEADEMLDMGFRDELERILKSTPAERRTLLFSATIPPGIASLAKRYQRDAVRLATAGEAGAHADIEQRAILIRPADRVGCTINVLRYHASPGALVFCATRDGVQEMARHLDERGFSVVALSGELSQRERTSALAQLRDGRARVLVATDVAARGLNLPDLDLVIHADLPNNREILIHRSGRTGRAGRKGTSVLLVPMARRGFVERVLAGRATKVAWTPAPSVDEIVARDLARLDPEITEELAELTDADRDLGKALASRVSAEDLAALVVRARLASAPEPVAIQAIDERPRRESGGPPRRESGPPRRDSGPPRRESGGHEASHRETAHREPAHREPAHRKSDDRKSDDRKSDDREPAAAAPRREPKGPPRAPAEGYVVFRVNVGRHSNADPRWLVPVLCRRGGIDKRSIGKIRILMGETHVEIASADAAAFAEAVARPDPRDKKIKIQPLA